MPDDRPAASPRLIIGLIMAALLVWASYLAIGAYYFNRNPWRPILVLGCMVVFVGWWLLLLWARSRRKQP